LQPLAMPGTFSEMHMVGFLPGSTVGQFSPAAVVQFLENVRRALTGAVRPAFVIGTDQCRDAGRLLSAYDDSAGISRAFNLNILSHLNRLAGCDLDLNSFGRKVLWNSREERVEMYLKSRSAQSARIAGRSILFAEGETIQTGISYKYAKERFLSIAAAAGWSSAGFWQDSEQLFGIHLLQAC
jgi:L-histidine N-alpha-methyltransferase